MRAQSFQEEDKAISTMNGTLTRRQAPINISDI